VYQKWTSVRAHLGIELEWIALRFDG